MFQVKIINDDGETIIHYSNSSVVKLISGQVKKSTNAIDSFEFSMLPDNPGYDLIQPLKTRIQVLRTDKNKLVFDGRIIQPKNDMDSSGLFSKTYQCESVGGYLHDIVPGYLTISGTLLAIVGKLLEVYNSQVEEWKKIYPGQIVGKTTMELETSPEKDLYDTIQGLIVTDLGYDWRIKSDDGKYYFDVAAQIGEISKTKIQIAKNLESMSVEDDPTSIITRMVPLGATKQDTTEVSGTDSVQKRVNLTDIGENLYVDDADLIASYGIQMGTKIFDEVTDATQLGSLAVDALKNQAVSRKLTVSAYDLSLIRLAPDDFSVYNFYPLVNPVLDINETIRVIGQTLDIINPQTANLTIGNKFKSASDYAIENLKDNDLIKQFNQKLKLASAEILTANQKIVELNKSLSNTAEAQNKQLSEMQKLIDQLKSQIDSGSGIVSYYTGAIIDVSEWQGTIDWPTVIKAGPALAVIRVQAGTSHEDLTYKTSIPAAISAGANYAVYAYFKAISDADAITEATNFYNRAQAVIGTNKQPRFWMIDLEEATMLNMQAGMIAYVNQLNKLGVPDSQIVIYSGYYFMNENWLTVTRNQLWIAAYGTNSGQVEPAYRPSVAYDLWQYTSVGSIAGITGNVDMSTEPSQRFKEAYLKK